MKHREFMNTEWRKLIMANYIVDGRILEPYIPAETEIDTWHGQVYVSLVGMMFYNTKVWNVPVPFHSDFPEVNLRFYVKHKHDEHYRRGIVFIKEFVPKPAIAAMANMLYKEHYITLPMNNINRVRDHELHIGYEWKFRNRWNKMEVRAGTEGHLWREGTEEEFINERLWGYTAESALLTREYYVEHPRWIMYPVSQFTIDCDFQQLFGSAFASLNTQAPVSVYLCEGSATTVFTNHVLS
jgi:uncharacterized protein YqjF (DUF2071 family)